jgi:Skp family chaperone for outer membrane proteins
LREAVEKEPEEQKQRALADGLQKLRRQAALEEAAANRAVTDLMLKAVQKLREKNGHAAVIAGRYLLDAARAVDLTDAVLKAMNAGPPPVFAALPEVTVSQPDKAKDAAGAAGEKKRH